jgi:hypothetical protein
VNDRYEEAPPIVRRGFFLPLSHKGGGEDLAGNQHASDNLGIDENPMLAESKRPGNSPAS